MIILTILCHLGTFTCQIYRKPWLECLWHWTANGADGLSCSLHAGPKPNPLFPPCRWLTISLQMLPPYFVAFLWLYFISCHIFLFHWLKSNYFSMAIWVSVNIFCPNGQWIMVSSPPRIVTYVRCSLCISPTGNHCFMLVWFSFPPSETHIFPGSLEVSFPVKSRLFSYTISCFL